jgi:hypothetical protein
LEPVPDSLAVRIREDVFSLIIGADGTFELRPPSGPIRFLMSFAGRDIATDWLVI